MNLDIDFFEVPTVEPYDPPPPPFGELTVNVERQRASRPNMRAGIVTTEPTGRTRIIIEGEDAHVEPFLTAVNQILNESGHRFAGFQKT